MFPLNHVFYVTTLPYSLKPCKIELKIEEYEAVEQKKEDDWKVHSAQAR